MAKNSFRSAWLINLGFLPTFIYLLFSVIYFWKVIPLTFRADFLTHLMRIVKWDMENDFFSYLPFIFEFQSGHVIALQKIIALINFYLFEHSALFSKAFGLSLMLLCWALYVYLGQKIHGKSDRLAVFSLIVALLIFSVQGYEVILWTDSISAHYPVACFAALCFYNVGKYFSSNKITHVKWVVFWAIISILTNGSGWAVLPTLLLLFLFHGLGQVKFHSKIAYPGKVKTIVTQLIIASVVLGFAANWVLSHANAGQTVTPLVNLERLFSQPLALFKHLMAVIASPISLYPIDSIWPYGVVVMLVAVWAIFRLIRLSVTSFSLWTGLIVFGVFSCLMVSIVRYEREFYEFGIVSSRYSIYAIPMYIGISAAFLLPEKIRKYGVFFDLLILFFFICSVYILIISSFYSQENIKKQSKEINEMTRQVPYWNPMAMVRISSAYDLLPRLYLETLPALAKQGKASVFTKNFIPAGGWDGRIKRVKDMLNSGKVVNVKDTNKCSVADGKLLALLDDRIIYEVRPDYGTYFVRFTGYIRDTEACDTPLEYLVALSHDSEVMCVSKVGVFVWDDLPSNAREPEDLMRSQYAFDFSCPILPKGKDIFPIMLVGYSPNSNHLQFLQQ